MDSDSEPPHRWLNLRFRPIPFFLIFFICISVTGVFAAVTRTHASPVHAPWGWLLAGLVLGWLGSALFSIIDYALFSLDPEEVENLALARPQSGQALKDLRSDLDHTWFTLLSGSLLFNLLFAFAAGALVARLVPFSAPYPTLVAGLVAVIAVALLGEALPRLMSARWMKDLAPFAARFTQVSSWALAPLFVIPLVLTRTLIRFSRNDMPKRRHALEAEKRLLALVGVGEVDVSLEEEEREMIDNAIEFGESTAGEIMVPRSEIVGIERSFSQEKVLDLLRTTKHRRLIVYNRSLDNVEGVLHAKQVLLNPTVDYHELLAAPLFVPEDMALLELIALMKQERRQIVVVLDEYGGTAGIVFMDNLLLELIGGRTHEESSSAQERRAL